MVLVSLLLRTVVGSTLDFSAVGTLACMTLRLDLCVHYLR